MYHVNNEGKIYPCRAVVRPCPYGKEWHAETKNELYHKILQESSPNEREIEDSLLRELQAIGRVKSLYSLSKRIEEVPYPLEILVSNIEFAINYIERKDPKKMERKWEEFKEEASEAVYNVLSYNLDLIDDIPQDIRQKGRELFQERLNGRYVSFAAVTGDKKGFVANDELKSMRSKFRDYEKYKKFGFTEEKKEATLRWLKRDFDKFSHDLNTSKILTKPFFYEDLDVAKKTIKTLDDYELLGAYDDYLVSDDEVVKDIMAANYFKYEPRPDLSREANLKMKEWYDRNRSIAKNWESHVPRRVLLSIEIGKELDRRGISRQ